MQVEVWGVVAGDFIDFETVETEEPVGLIEAVFADDGRLGEALKLL